MAGEATEEAARVENHGTVTLTDLLLTWPAPVLSNPLKLSPCKRFGVLKEILEVNCICIPRTKKKLSRYSCIY